jgi:hypothetical protein
MPTPDYEHVIGGFHFSHDASVEVYQLADAGLQELYARNVVPGGGVYQGALRDFQSFLEDAHRESIFQNRREIDVNVLLIIKGRRIHVWPFF